MERADSLIAARAEFAREKVGEFREEFLREAERVITIARREAVMAEALGVNLWRLSNISIPDPEPTNAGPGVLDKVLKLHEQRCQGGLWIDHIPETPETKALSTELAPFSQTCTAVSRELNEIRNRRANEERARKQAELDAQWEKRPAFSATTLPVSSFALKGIEAEELKNQKLRENFKVEYSTATPFPNNPERR